LKLCDVNKVDLFTQVKKPSSWFIRVRPGRYNRGSDQIASASS
jgi:hypothetical protein